MGMQVVGIVWSDCSIPPHSHAQSYAQPQHNRTNSVYTAAGMEDVVKYPAYRQKKQ